MPNQYHYLIHKGYPEAVRKAVEYLTVEVSEETALTQPIYFEWVFGGVWKWRVFRPDVPEILKTAVIQAANIP